MGMNSGKSIDIILNVINFCSEGVNNLIIASSAPAKTNSSLLVPSFLTLSKQLFSQLPLEVVFGNLFI